MRPNYEYYNTTTPEITQEYFDEVFADLIAMPSYLQIAQAEGVTPDPNLTEWYNDAVEKTRDVIYETPGLNQKTKEKKDRNFLCDIFASSDGAETRMVFTGFKPAAFIAAGCYQNGKPDHYDQNSLLIHGAPNPNFGFVKNIGPNTEEENPVYDSGFIFNKSAVENTAVKNHAIFEALGFDTSLSGDKFAEDVFSSNDLIAQSILLGYSPFTAITFYLHCPGDIGGWGQINDGGFNESSYGRRFLESAHILLSPTQYNVVEYLYAYPDQTTQLDLIKDATMGKDFIYHTDNNQFAQRVIKMSGMHDYVHRLQGAMYKEIDSWTTSLL